MKAPSNLLALSEGSAVEFKRSLRSDLGREICAFANATGGVILRQALLLRIGRDAAPEAYATSRGRIASSASPTLAQSSG